MDALAGPLPRRRSWRFRLAVSLSLLIHIGTGVLLLVTIRREGEPELLPPPSAVTMLFETGRRQGPTLPNPEPNPGLQATPSAPTVEAPGSAPELVPPEPVRPEPAPPPGTPLGRVPLPAPPLPPVVQPPTPPAPEQPAQQPQPAAPQPETLPPVERPAPEPIPLPPPAPLPPPPDLEPAPIPPLPPPSPPRLPPLAPVPLQPALPAPVPPQPVPTPPRPVPRPAPAAPRPPPAPPKASDFPPPVDFSLGKPAVPSTPSPARARTSPRVPGTIDMSLGPASKGIADPTPRSDREEELAGADYRNALSRWVSEHAYYPEQARRAGDEGDAKVHVLAGPDGRVKEVQLIGKSGSIWLDLALLSLFRDQQIPPYPGGGGEPIEFNFTMHYVLIRPR
jgi:periplasmic protein TonB